jgi:hypothetical protein
MSKYLKKGSVKYGSLRKLSTSPASSGDILRLPPVQIKVQIAIGNPFFIRQGISTAKHAMH